MYNKKLKIYLASSWFTDNTRQILDHLESKLSEIPDIDLYSPRRDGIVLPFNQKHDTSLRESIFKENISNILKSDLVVANIYSGDHYNDPGTIYEIGYAMANGIPVVGFTPNTENINERFLGTIEGFSYILHSYTELDEYLDKKAYRVFLKDKSSKGKVLFVGSGNSSLDENLISHIMENGINPRWVNETHEKVYNRIDEMFEGVDYAIIVVDDRKTLNSWMLGQAYARNIPIITYSNHNYGVNIMLLCSILTHLRGTSELDAFLQQVNRYGLESIPKFDISQLDAM